MAEKQRGWGGTRSGAGNPEFKAKWKSGKTMVIRVPEAIADEVLAVARQIDDGKAVTHSSTEATGETTNAVRQWCVFARHDNRLRFMGSYSSKAEAEGKAHRAERERRLDASMGDHPYTKPPTYEVKEMLVAPVDLYSKSDTTAVTQSSESLKHENERLREQIKEYQQGLEESAVSHSSDDELRRLQAVVNLEKQQKEVCQQKLDKAQQSNKELAKLAREARAELEQLQSSTSSPDPGTILHRLRKERRKSKADLKDVELILELLQAIAL